MKYDFWGILQGLLNVIGSILEYIVNIRIVDIPYHIFIFAMSGVFGYCASLIIIGFPCAVWEAITKRKIPDEKQDKVIKIVAVCLFIILLLSTLYAFSTN